jgi:protein SCO1/2
MGPRNLIVAVVLVAALVSGIFVATQLQKRPVEPRTALVLPAPTPLPEFELVDQFGDAVTPATFRGQWSLVFFGFTHCPDICPLTLQVLASARDSLRAAGYQPLPRIVLVSVDPERDTPELMGRYVNHFGDGNLGLTGELVELTRLTSALGIYFQKQPGDAENYAVDHSAAVLLIDPRGNFHALFSGPHVAEDYVYDLPIIMEAE